MSPGDINSGTHCIYFKIWVFSKSFERSFFVPTPYPYPPLLYLHVVFGCHHRTYRSLRCLSP